MTTLTIWIAEYLLYAVIVALAIFWIRLARPLKISLAVLGIAAGIIGLILIKLAGAVYYDPRPFVQHHTVPLFPHDPDNGFPSDHTALLTVLALCTYKFSKPLGMVFLFCAVVVGAARVIAQVHSPLDIIASLIIGTIAVVAANWLTERFLTTDRVNRILPGTTKDS